MVDTGVVVLVGDEVVALGITGLSCVGVTDGVETVVVVPVGVVVVVLVTEVVDVVVVTIDCPCDFFSVRMANVPVRLMEALINV